WRQRSGRGVMQQLEAPPARAVAAHLNRDRDQRLSLALAAAATVAVAAAEEALIDLDLAREGLALRCHHRPAQLVQDRPGGLIAGDAELALQLQRRDTRPVRADQVSRPEPQGQRQTRLVHCRPGRHRRLAAATPTLPQVTAVLDA